MNNIDKWKPTVIHKVKGHFRVNRDFVGIRSELVASRAIENYVELMKEHAGGQLLDLGCANVPYYEVYKDQVENIICIDWEDSLHKNKHLDYSADLNKKIPLDDGTADTVILTDVLEHISQPYVLMKEISRILSVGGKLILGVPFFTICMKDPLIFIDILSIN